jgi:hypothetical protein
MRLPVAHFQVRNAVGTKKHSIISICVEAVREIFEEPDIGSKVDVRSPTVDGD